jgi:hypothetical protein
MTLRLMRAGVRRFYGFYRAADVETEVTWELCSFLPDELLVHLGRGEKGDGDRHHARYALQGEPEEIAAWAEQLARKMRMYQGAVKAELAREP